MKNILQNLKKPVTLLSVLAILLIIAQFAAMFIPCFNMTPAATRREPNPQPKDYSLFSYCWTDCEEMSKILKKEIDDYYINDYVTDMILANAFAVISLIFLIVELKHIFQNYKVGGAKAVKLLSNIFCIAWAAQSVYAFLTADIFSYCVAGSPVQTIEIGISVAAAVVVLVRAVIAFVGRTRYVVAK